MSTAFGFKKCFPLQTHLGEKFLYDAVMNLWYDHGLREIKSSSFKVSDYTSNELGREVAAL